VLTNLLPGDPTLSILGEQATLKQRTQTRAEYGLDRPLPVRYVSWLGRAVQGDLGRSLRTGQPVVAILAERLPVTFELTFLGMLIAILIGIPAGILAARFRNGFVDVVVTLAALAGLAIPFFWLGFLLILLFALELKLLPPSGYVSPIQSVSENLRLMIMPSLTIGIAFSAALTRQTRASMLRVLSSDYIRTARAKGAPETRLLLKHALRNALIPVVTVFGLQTGTLLGGAIVTETVFALPGVGRMMVDGIFQRDFPVIQGALLVSVVAVLVVNLLTDASYLLIDPRIRTRGRIDA
jgi:peptide/nickel transport system permease protein